MSRSIGMISAIHATQPANYGMTASVRVRAFVAMGNVCPSVCFAVY